MYVFLIYILNQIYEAVLCLELIFGAHFLGDRRIVNTIYYYSLSDVCALNNSQKRCIIMFYSGLFLYSYLCYVLFVYSYLCYVELSTYLFSVES